MSHDRRNQWNRTKLEPGHSEPSAPLVLVRRREKALHQEVISFPGTEERNAGDIYILGFTT